MEMDMLGKLRSPINEFGFIPGLLYGIDRLLQQLSPRLRLYFYEFLMQPIPDKPLLAGRFANSFEMREIKRGDPEIALMPALPEIKESRFNQNAICIGVFRKNQLVGYIWFCFRAYEEDEVRCTFLLPDGDQSVFDFDLYIFPEHRMGLGFVAVWNAANEFLRKRGIRQSFSRLTRTNIASRSAHIHLGIRRVGRAVFLQAWSLELMVATIPPFLHLSLTRGHRIRLKLHPGSVPMEQARRAPQQVSG
jgi:hypothetical protein